MPKSSSNRLKVAVAQVSPVFQDLEASLDLACEIIIDAGREGADLVVLPEAFLPGYPEWAWQLPPDQSELQNRLYALFVASTVVIPGPVTDKLCRAAQRARINVVIGLVEHDLKVRENICYNTLLFIDSQGQISGKQRQLTLNGAERLVWTAGDGSTFGAAKFSFGKVGGLISGDSYMPLIRYALYSWDIRLCIVTNNRPDETWIFSMRHIAREGGIYVIGCGRAVRPGDTLPETTGTNGETEWLYKGGSLVVNPAGEIIAGPYWNQQGVFYANLNRDEILAARRLIDVTGQNSIFELIINRGAASDSLPGDSNSELSGPNK
jgi:nitrilase